MRKKITGIIVVFMLLLVACGETEQEVQEVDQNTEDTVHIGKDTKEQVNKEEQEKKVDKQKQQEDEQDEEAQKEQKEEEKNKETKKDSNTEEVTHKKKEEKIHTKPIEGNFMSTVELNIRKGPGLSEVQIGVLSPGQKAVASEQANVDGLTWYRIQVGDQTGWASSHYLTDYKKQEEANKDTQKTNNKTSQNKGTTDSTASASDQKTKDNKNTKKTEQKQEENKQSKTVQLKVPYINQYEANAPMGCEASALLQGLHYQGNAQGYNLAEFLKEMPISEEGNPHNGFGGTPYEVVKGTYQSIFPQALASWGSQYGNVVDISGTSTDGLKKELDNGNPIVVYVTLDFNNPIYNDYFWGKGIDNAHVVTFTGYKSEQMHITDPARGQYWVDESLFTSRYNLTKRAAVIR